MAEIPVDIDISGTIFVDVSTGEQYPISEFSEILQAQPVKNEVQEIQECSNKIAQVLGTQGGQDVAQCGQDIGVQNNLASQNTKTKVDISSCHDPVPQRIRCPECQRYTAETEEKMLRHIRKVHRGENPFQCYMCDYSTYNKCLFEEHVRIHQGIKPFKCSQCPYRSVSKKNTKKHELIHRPDNPLKCSECDFIARHPRALDSHNKVHNVEPKSKAKKTKAPMRCPDCSFKYETTEAMTRHRKDRRRCKQCQHVACSRNLLKVHMERVHNVQFIPKNPKKENTFSCSLCEWSSSNKPRILLHLIHHPNQEVDENIVDITVLRECGIMV